MPKVTGRAIIRVDGKQWRTEDGATLSPGGAKREAVSGAGQVYGYKESTEPPELSCKVFHTADTDLIALGEIANATVIFECDSGDAYVLRNAFVTDVPSLETGSGAIDVKFSGISCKRI